MCGAQVVITSSSDAKLERAKALGADFAINYARRPDWAAAVLEATDGRGADIVVETGGGATISQSIAAAAPNGRVAIIGSLSGGFVAEAPNFATLIGKNLMLKGIAAGNRRMLQDFITAAAANGLDPQVDRVYSVTDAPAAYARLKSGDHVGKLMVDLAGWSV